MKLRVVYADILLLVNFCADFILLYICGLVLTLNIKTYRLCFGAMLGALYCFVCEVLLYGTHYLYILFSLAFVPLICFTAYKYTSRLAFIKLCIFFLVACTLLDGGMQFMSRIIITLSSGALLKNGVSVLTFVILITILSAVCICIILLFKKSHIYKIQTLSISADGTQKHEFQLMCDTGNMLVDSYTGLPVIVVKKDKAKIFGFDVTDIRYGARFIPVKTVSGDACFAMFKPCCIELVRSKRRIPISAMLAFDNGECTYNGADGALPYELIENL